MVAEMPPPHMESGEVQGRGSNSWLSYTFQNPDWVREGKIVVDNMYYDNLAVAAQLGLLPQDDSATV